MSENLHPVYRSDHHRLDRSNLFLYFLQRRCLRWDSCRQSEWLKKCIFFEKPSSLSCNFISRIRNSCCFIPRTENLRETVLYALTGICDISCITIYYVTGQEYHDISSNWVQKIQIHSIQKTGTKTSLSVGKATPPPLKLDPVYLIQIDSYFVLFKEVS